MTVRSELHLPPSAEILVHLNAIRFIVSKRAKDLLQAQSGKGFGDPFRRLAPQIGVDHGVQ